ncbi:hypothetical protein [Pararhizobium sp. PWRC1-1]|uniref:hypothetical protein n=1 Tax=Pararhizobium sp. PWRC1-1 TaxID=2804566 RepID=UPI003CE74860
MKIVVAFCAMSLAAAMPATADNYDSVYRGLTTASFRHLEAAYRCRSALGPSAYTQARVAAENIMRLSGVPTDVALREVTRMVRKIEARPAASAAAIELYPCIADVRDTLSEIHAWQSRVEVYWR